MDCLFNLLCYQLLKILNILCNRGYNFCSSIPWIILVSRVELPGSNPAVENCFELLVFFNCSEKYKCMYLVLHHQHVFFFNIQMEALIYSLHFFSLNSSKHDAWLKMVIGMGDH